MAVSCVNNLNEKVENHSVDKNEKENIESYFEGYFDQNSKEIEEGEIEADSDTKHHITEHWRQWEEFAKSVKWFYKEHFNQKDKKYPSKLPNGCDIELLDLYMYVEEAGGYFKVAKDNKWPKIAIKLGFDKAYATNLMIIYQGYLDLMSWKYLVTKHGENKIGEPSGSMSMNEEVAEKVSNMEEDEKVDMEDVQEENKESVGIGAIQNEELDFQIEDFDDVDLNQEDYEILIG
ncbi:hypothetical protein R6Q59_015677 [Mikania micrantha]